MQEFRVWLAESISVETTEGCHVPAYFKPLEESDATICPQCGSRMVLRTNSKTQIQFYGCSRYPNCKATMGYNSKSGTGHQAPRKTEPQPAQQPKQQGFGLKQPAKPTTAPKDASKEGDWIYAKSKFDDKVLHLQAGQNVMLRPPNSCKSCGAKNQKGKVCSACQAEIQRNWVFASIYKGKIHRYGEVPESELGARFERISEATGDPKRSMKPSEAARELKGQEDKKPFALSAQQQEIADRFAEMHGGENSHMVISARAGTGKTTMLKHLAKQFGRNGEKWLYLVFGSKNQEEAEESFPKFVDVMTTHSYAGYVLDSNKIKPTQRIYNYIPNLKNANKLSHILDSDHYSKVARSLNILDPGKLGHSQNESYAKGWISKIWKEFKREVETIVGLLKAFNLNPAMPDFEQRLRAVLAEYDINSNLEETKEKLEKNPNFEFFNETISTLMGIDNFLAEDFLEQMIQAATWVMQVSRPHGIDQEFQQTHAKDQKTGHVERLQQPVTQNLRGMRDFDDDLWFAAMHADELNWTKPEKYQFVLVDEVQDFNIAQKKILEKLIQTGARIVAVGDPNQAMYRFRGADKSAFHDITQMLVGASENKDPSKTLKRLTLNFRSKPGLIARANQGTVVNDLESGIPEDPFDPEVYTNKELDDESMMSMLQNEMEQLGELQKETAIIARTNEPLAKTAMQLMKVGIPFVILGLDLSGTVLGLINRVLGWQNYKKVNDDSSIGEFSDELKEFVESKKEKWNNQSKKAGQLKDLMEGDKAIQAAMGMIAELTNRDPFEITIKEFKDWLHTRLGGVPEKMNAKQKAEHKEKLRRENPVTLLTAHKAKGLEFDRVFEITPSLYPHPRASLPADIEQEDNAWYVGHTRAKDDYHIVSDEEKKPMMSNGPGQNQRPPYQREWTTFQEVKSRLSKKIYNKWIMGEKTPWKKPTMNKAIDNWIYKRFKDKGVSDRAW